MVDFETYREGRHRQVMQWGLTIAVLSILLIGSATFAVTVGSTAISAGDVWSVVARNLSASPGVGTVDVLVWELRLPRVFLAVLVGGSLAAVGVVLQGVVHNPLADPSILGSSAGASLGAVLVIVSGFGSLGGALAPVGAFLGAAGAFALVLAFGRTGGQIVPLKLILVGVAVSAALGALTSYIVIGARDEDALRGALFWMLGSLGGARWSQLAIPAMALVAIGARLIYRGRVLNALATGDESAATLGIDVARLRLELVGLSAVLVGVSVSLSGIIGFVALVIPHVGRMAVGADHTRLLPVSILIGAIFLVWIDLAARTFQAPAEIPVGVITSLIGGPALLYLLWRNDGVFKGIL